MVKRRADELPLVSFDINGLRNWNGQPCKKNAQTNAIHHVNYPLCSDQGVNALQYLDVINMKDVQQKRHFFSTTLRDSLKHIPRVCSTRTVFVATTY